MFLKSGTIIPFIFKDVKKLIAITSLNKNEKLHFNDIETAIYSAFENLKNKCEFLNPKIAFHIPNELLISYLEQRHDLNNFVVEIVETDEIRTKEYKEQTAAPEPQNSNENNISHKRVSSEVSTMDNKKSKVDYIDENLENILKITPKGQEICKNFENSKKLSGEDRLALIKLVISSEFKNLVRSKAPIAIETKRLVHITGAICCRFPGEDQSEYLVEHSSSFKYFAGGKLYEKFLEKKFQYIKLMESKGRYLMASDEGDEGRTERDFPELMELTEITENWEIFFRAWQYTYDLRVSYFKNTCEPLDFFGKFVEKFPDKFTDLVEYDFERLHPKKTTNLFDNWDQLMDKIFAEAHVIDLKDVSLIHETYGHMSELSGLMMLSYFIENYGRNATPFEKDNINNLVIHVESVVGDPKEFFKDYYDDYIQNERLIVFAAGKTSDELTFYVLIGYEVLCMETALKAVDLCFKCYQILHMDYPDDQAQNWHLMQNAFYDIDRMCNMLYPKAAENVLQFLKNLTY